MPGKANSLCVLLDANIIIQAHVSGVWSSLMEKITLVAPSIVLQEATHYIDPGTEMRMEIHLDKWVTDGSLRKVEASAEQISAHLMRFDPVFVQRMDRGEAEALALLAAGALSDHRFCTADGPAIQALCLLDIPDAGISFESLLRDTGLYRKLPPKCSEAFFREHLTIGAQKRITGEGLRRKPSVVKASRTNRKKRK